MQLFEFFMWKNTQDHSLASKLSFLSLQLQPFALAASLYYYSLKAKPGLKYSNLEKVVLLVVASLSLMKALSAAKYAFITDTKTKWLSVRGPHCHLIWWFNTYKQKMPFLARIDNLWAILLFTAILMIRPFTHALVYFLLGTVSAIITTIYYPKEEGSLWCWLANFMAVSAIAMPYVKIFISV